MTKYNVKIRTEIRVSGITGFIEGKVTPIGNGAKVGCPKEYIGKKVYIIVGGLVASD